MSKIPQNKNVEGIFKCPRCKKNTSIINFDRWQKQIIDGKEKWIFHREGYESGYYGGFNDERWIEEYSSPGWFGYAHYAINYAYDDSKHKYSTAEECWEQTGGETTEKWNYPRGENWVCQYCKYSSKTFTDFISR